MGWPIAAELSSYRLRAKTISIGVICQTFSTWLTLFTVPYMYNVDSGDLGARTGFVFVGTTVLLLAAGWYLVPDTTGLTAEQIDHAYEQRVSPRKFQSIVGSGEFAAEEKGLDV
jgi:Sugar (and other) transporter